MICCGSYLALYLAGTAALAIVTCLGAPVAANPVWTTTCLLARRVLKNLSALMNLLEAVSTAATAIVATAENFSAWLRTVEPRCRDVLETANLDCMSTLGYLLFNFYITLEKFQVQHLVAEDSFLDMATWKLHVFNPCHARATIFTTKFGTFMLTGRSNACTRLSACEAVMHDC